MQDHPRRDQAIAAALAGLAGLVDAVGFIASGGQCGGGAAMVIDA